MVTAKLNLTGFFRVYRWFVLAAILLTSAAVGWWYWAQQSAPVSAQSKGAGAPNKKPLSDPVPSPLSPTASEGATNSPTAPAAKAVFPPGPALPPATPAIAAPAGKGARASAAPILVESNGSKTVLDVQTIMALQRSKAERRLYDRVLALSETGGNIGNAIGISAPKPNAPDNSMSTLMGNGRSASTVEAIPGLPAGKPTTNPSASGNAAAIADTSVRQLRLISVYVQNDFWMAELLFSNGRRLELEVDDELDGYRVTGINENGIHLWPTHLQVGQGRFLTVGQKIEISGAAWRQ